MDAHYFFEDQKRSAQKYKVLPFNPKEAVVAIDTNFGFSES